MKIKFEDHQAENLLVYFAGWGTPISAVSHLAMPENYDLLICYDYQDLSLDFDFSRYQKIRVVAWSMGVWVAERALQGIPLESATAVNGTGLPCDDQVGIPFSIFKGTLDNLNETTRAKFDRRICGDKTNLAFYHSAPARGFQEIQQELTALFHAIEQDQRTDLVLWTNAIIGRKDKIFSAENQQRYWQTRCKINEIEGEHYLFSHLTHWAQLWN
ncbi:DUF452 family protein [Pasteurella caecimuris]|uniref:pimeloyl-ACP methyl esterase BioG family protein n=1 Tax=Rodentibacter caecimuris TaxID=1796644 RepID=UPI0021505A08|nr:pimeloyl-ACP methyl esterase BioG family protein [Pasteurella caecimuris]MCR1837744.1 DUF452 family protein [Pasteurella caecimuris]MCU0106479.1 DUF452 family protein [Pasteurella caecimuris]